MLEVLSANRDLLTALLAVAGLLWAFGSFYWLHWRRGKIVVSAPRSYKAASVSDRIIVDLPLVFLNTGAIPILINNLHLHMSQASASVWLRFNATREELGAKEQSWATQMLVQGGRSLATVCSFLQAQPEGERFTFSPGVWDFALWGRLDDSAEWRVLKKFQIPIDESGAEIMNRGQFIAHDACSDGPPGT